MTPEEARQIIVEGINYAAYRETDSSLYGSDKNRLFGSEHYNSGRHVLKPSPWSEGNFEEKMAMQPRWAVAPPARDGLICPPAYDRRPLIRHQPS
jgi:hypothetical protein